MLYSMSFTHPTQLPIISDDSSHPELWLIKGHLYKTKYFENSIAPLPEFNPTYYMKYDLTRTPSDDLALDIPDYTWIL